MEVALCFWWRLCRRACISEELVSMEVQLEWGYSPYPCFLISEELVSMEVYRYAI